MWVTWQRLPAEAVRPVNRADAGGGDDESALVALLGRPRARILALLDDPRPAGWLAEALTATPGAATYHLNALESAGLVVRERSGRTVMVHRTSRGSALLRLYGKVSP
jgi:DNA-binding transcriptional ArsR family regulator